MAENNQLLRSWILWVRNSAHTMGGLSLLCDVWDPWVEDVKPKGSAITLLSGGWCCWLKQRITNRYQNYIVCILSHIWLFSTLWTVALQAPLSMGFSRQKYWSGFPCPPPGALLHPGIEPRLLCLLHWQADSLPLYYLGSWSNEDGPPPISWRL